ncbi:MAG: hypothetical protein ACJA16_004071 [Akkermansiaceae bacterium]|jgi:hypothetical protein
MEGSHFNPAQNENLGLPICGVNLAKEVAYFDGVESGVSLFFIEEVEELPGGGREFASESLQSGVIPGGRLKNFER